MGDLRTGAARLVFLDPQHQDRAVSEAADVLRRRGATVVELRPPDLREGFEIFYRLPSADRLAGMRRFLGDTPRVAQIKQVELSTRTPSLR